MTRTLLTGARIFDGRAVHDGLGLLIEDGLVAAILPGGQAGDVPPVDLGGGWLAPGFVDLQVNGGGGAMLGDAPASESLARICAAHGRLGTTGLLPTLISDRPETTRAVIEAAIAAAQAGLPGLLGLHLEGPHLDPRRCGAHDPALLCPMTDADLALFLRAAAALPALMVTLAPEAATPAQITALAQAGVIVSLGHSGCDSAAARAAFDAGARAVTHLFNAMSPLGHRAPGLVGAALDDARISAGLIADGVHVLPEVLRIAVAAKRGAGRLFLVTDAMAVAGTDAAGFALQGRPIRRAAGQLVLADGTLAGADCDMAACLRVMVGQVGLTPAEALAMATSVPADLIGQGHRAGRIAAGRSADLVHLDDDLRLTQAWRAGVSL